MKEKGKNHLRQAIDKLKVYEAPDVWMGVEKELKYSDERERQNLDKGIDSLPEKEAPDIWTSIENELEKTDVKPLSPWKKISWVAAAFVILGLIGYTLRPGLAEDVEGEVVAYSTEEVIFFNVREELRGFETGEDEVLDFIEKNCKNLVAKCQNPEFEELFGTYVELIEAKKELETQLDNTPNKEQLIKYLIRIEKNRTEVGKDMLDILKYS